MNLKKRFTKESIDLASTPVGSVDEFLIFDFLNSLMFYKPL